MTLTFLDFFAIPGIIEVVPLCFFAEVVILEGVTLCLGCREPLPKLFQRDVVRRDNVTGRDNGQFASKTGNLP